MIATIFQLKIAGSTQSNVVATIDASGANEFVDFNFSIYVIRIEE